MNKKKSKREIGALPNKNSNLKDINSSITEEILSNLENSEIETLKNLQKEIKNEYGLYITLCELHRDSINYFSDLMSFKGGIFFYLDSKGLF